MDFKGFEDWMEIFAGGKVKDSQGVEHDGDDLIQKAISQFDTSKHEPPITIGHPADNSPAYGWIEGLKEGVSKGRKVLFAKVTQVVPEFEEMVKNGQFKKRSASFYPDGSLRHVGFLGAMPPAVKGLTDLSFEEDPNVFITFSDDLPNRKAQETKKEINMAEEKQEQTPTAPATQTQAPINYQEIEDKVKAKMEREFEEKLKKERERNNAQFAEFVKQQQAKEKRARIDTFVETGIATGQVLPAWVDAGMKNFMEALDTEAPINFGEGKYQKSAGQWFMDFVTSLPKSVEFKEIANKQNEQPKAKTAAERMDEAITKKMKEGKDWNVAFNEVQIEDPQLTTQYLAEI